MRKRSARSNSSSDNVNVSSMSVTIAGNSSVQTAPPELSAAPVLEVSGIAPDELEPSAVVAGSVVVPDVSVVPSSDDESPHPSASAPHSPSTSQRVRSRRTANV